MEKSARDLTYFAYESLLNGRNLLRLAISLYTRTRFEHAYLDLVTTNDMHLAICTMVIATWGKAIYFLNVRVEEVFAVAVKLCLT